MNPRLWGVLALLWSSAAVAASPPVARTTPQSAEAQPTGSGRVTGRVLASDNRAPVRRALVRLTGLADALPGSNPRHVSRQVETDDGGAFQFIGLPRGSFSIDVPGTNGFVGTERGTRVVVGDTGAIAVSIHLERTGAIVGRISDRHGDGVLGVDVQALRRSDFRGHVTFLPAYPGRGSTNDLGQFRLFNLPPGEYFVVATPLYSDRDVQTARGSGFVPTYYPGTLALRDARRVVVRAGRDVANVDFSLASGPLARVTVEAVDSRGVPLGRETSASLNLRSDVHLSTSMRMGHRQEGGSFTFSEVVPGEYDLIVNGPRMEEAAYTVLKVDADVTLKVQTNRGANLSGRVVVQGPVPDPRSGRRLGNAIVTATRPRGRFGPAYAKEPLINRQGAGTFDLNGLRGPMVLHAEMGGASLVSIGRAGGPDLAGKTIDYAGTETIDDLVVVFTTERAEVRVTLTGLREPNDPEKVMVMLFADDPARWHAGWLQYTVIESSTEMPVQRGGRTFTLQLGSVVPGRYLLAAVPTPGMMFPTEPAILERLRPIAVPVTLVAGETATAEVGVNRAVK